MNQTLIDAIKEVEALPDEEQEALGRELMKLALRKQIEAELAASEAEGGEIPHEDVVARIRARYAS